MQVTALAHSLYSEGSGAMRAHAAQRPRLSRTVGVLLSVVAVALLIVGVLLLFSAGAGIGIPIIAVGIALVAIEQRRRIG